MLNVRLFSSSINECKTWTEKPKYPPAEISRWSPFAGIDPSLRIFLRILVCPSLSAWLVFLVALLSPMSAYARGALLELEEPAVDLPHRGHDPLGSFDLVAFWTLGVENLSRRESEKKWFSALPTKRGGCLQEVDQ